MPVAPDERLALARRRILRVLRTNQVCSLRTLENKISDAGPYGMRIDPHLISDGLRQLERQLGQVIRIPRPTGHWFTLPSVPQSQIDARLAELEPIQMALGR